MAALPSRPVPASPPDPVREALLRAPADDEPYTAEPVERWCEAFAAAALIPWNDAQAYLTERFHWTPRTKVHDLAVASGLARRFKTSLRAAVLAAGERAPRRGETNTAAVRQVCSVGASRPMFSAGTTSSAT